MKQILIIPGNTDLNRGDQALVWESISLVEDVYGKEETRCVLMSELEGEVAYLQNRQTKELGYKFVNTLIKHPGRHFTTKVEDSKGYSRLTLLQWGLQALRDYFHTRPLLSNNKLIQKAGEFFLNKAEINTLNTLKCCDAVFVKGGGFIHSYGAITDPYFIYFLTYHIRLAEAYGKKVFLLPNSIGPLNNGLAKKIALKAIKNCDLVTVRENISKELLLSLGVDAFHFPDLGFYLKPSAKDMRDYLSNKGVPLKQKKVVITLRPYRFQGFESATKLYDNYINGFVGFVQSLIEKEFHITFMAHTLGPSTHEDDRIAIKEVLNRLPNGMHKDISYIEDYDLDCRDVEKIYSYYDYMIGTRFHSVIFSLNVGVPAIAIAYGGNKSRGIMSVIGNGDFCIDMDKVQVHTLIEKFDELELCRETYLANLKDKKSIIIEQRKQMIDLIRMKQTGNKNIANTAV